MAGLKRREQQQRGHDGEQQYGIKSGKDSPDTPLIEAQIAEAAGAYFREDVTANKVAGDDKEDIYASEAAGEPAEAAVIEDNAENGKSAKAVDVGTIGTVGSCGIGGAHAGRSGETTKLQWEGCGTLQMSKGANGNKERFCGHSISNGLAGWLARSSMTQVRFGA